MTPSAPRAMYKCSVVHTCSLYRALEINTTRLVAGRRNTSRSDTSDVGTLAHINYSAIVTSLTSHNQSVFWTYLVRFTPPSICRSSRQNLLCRQNAFNTIHFWASLPDKCTRRHTHQCINDTLTVTGLGSTLNSHHISRTQRSW